MQLVCCRQRIGRSSAVVTVTVECPALVTQVGVGESIEYLAQRADAGGEFSENLVGVGRAIEDPAVMCRAAQCLGGLRGIGYGVVELGYERAFLAWNLSGRCVKYAGHVCARCDSDHVLVSERTTEGTILEAIKSIPEIIKNWRDNRDLLYQVMAGISAALVTVAVETGTRPSDSLAAVARSLGAEPIADWLGTNAPPVLAVSLPLVQSMALSAVLVLLAAMVFVPLWRSRHHDNQRFGYEPLRLLGSPAAATIWVLLLIAAQQGPLAPMLQRWEGVALSAVSWTIGGLLFAGLLYLVANRYGFGELVRLLFWPMTVMIYRVFFAAVAAVFAIVLAAISLPLSIVSWVGALEPDHERRRREEIEWEEVERAPQPAGARVVPVQAM